MSKVIISISISATEKKPVATKTVHQAFHDKAAADHTKQAVWHEDKALEAKSQGGLDFAKRHTLKAKLHRETAAYHKAAAEAGPVSRKQTPSVKKNSMPKQGTKYL